MGNKAYFEENLNALSTSAPRLATKIRLNKESYLSVSDAVRFFEAKTGAVAAECQVDDQAVALVSAYDPVKQAQGFVEKFYSSECGCFIVVGLQCGYLIRALLSQCTSEQCILVISPAQDLFEQQLCACPLDDVLADSRLHLLQEDDPDRALCMARSFLWVNTVRSLLLVVPPVMQQIAPEFVQSFHRLLKDEQEIVAKDRQEFIDGCGAIRDQFFNEDGMMGELDAFFKRIEKKQAERPLTLVESCYLLIKMFFYYKSYEENTA